MLDLNYNYKKHLFILIVSIILGILWLFVGLKAMERFIFISAELEKMQKISLFMIPIILPGSVNGFYFEARCLSRKNGTFKKILIIYFTTWLFISCGTITLIPVIIYDIYKLFFDKKAKNNS